MAAAESIPPTFELGEFIAKVVLDSFTGVTAGLRLQEEQQAELAAMTSLDLTAFAELAVSDQEVDAELARLFPSADRKHPSAIYTGAPYSPKVRPDSVESPPLQTTLSILIEQGDYKKQARSKSPVLTTAGVDKIRSATKARLGQGAQTVLKKMLAQGLPHVFVNSGKVTAKVSMILEPSGVAKPPRKTVALKDARILVQMVDDKSTQSQPHSVDTVSEIEINFKTIT